MNIAFYPTPLMGFTLPDNTKKDSTHTYIARNGFVSTALYYDGTVPAKIGGISLRRLIMMMTTYIVQEKSPSFKPYEVIREWHDTYSKVLSGGKHGPLNK